MKSILTDLWHGDIAPVESIPTAPAYRAALRRVVEAENRLLPQLPKECVPLWEAFQDRYSELTETDEKLAFAAGFRLGMRLLLEALPREI